MNDQILFEIAKHVESSSSVRGRLRQALASEEARCQRFLTSRKIIEKKMCMREDLEHLRDKNIYRDDDSQANFQKIRHELERVIGLLCPRKHAYAAVKISPRIAGLAKNLDFELRKRLLQRAFQQGDPARGNTHVQCARKVCRTPVQERREHFGA